MRVLAVGGAGGMGRHACRAVTGLDGVDELVITDLDGTQLIDEARHASVFRGHLLELGVAQDELQDSRLSAMGLG